MDIRLERGKAIAKTAKIRQPEPVIGNDTLKDGAELATFTPAPGTPPDVDVDAEFTMTVTFGKGSPAPVGRALSILSEIEREVQSTIARFEGFFPSPT